MRALTPQFFQQRLGVLEVGGVETLSEPAVDVGEHGARLVAMALLSHQPREAGGRTQFKRLCVEIPRDIQSFPKAVGCLLCARAPKQHLAFQASCLSCAYTLSTFLYGSQCLLQQM